MLKDERSHIVNFSFFCFLLLMSCLITESLLNTASNYFLLYLLKVRIEQTFIVSVVRRPRIECNFLGDQGFLVTFIITLLISFCTQFVFKFCTHSPVMGLAPAFCTRSKQRYQCLR